MQRVLTCMQQLLYGKTPRTMHVISLREQMAVEKNGRKGIDAFEYKICLRLLQS